MRNEKEEFNKKRHLEKEFGRRLKYEPTHEASSFREIGKPVIYLEIFHKDNINGWHWLYDESDDTGIKLLGTNEEVEREANRRYGKKYEIITTPASVEPMSEFGQFTKVIDRYRKKKIVKPKSKRKVKKCRCKS